MSSLLVLGVLLGPSVLVPQASTTGTVRSALAGAPPTIFSHTVTAGSGTSFTSSPIASNPGDTVLVILAIRASAGVTSVTDSAGDSFVPLGYDLRTDGSSHEGLSVWASWNVSGSSTVSVSATTNFTARVVLLVVDATGVAPDPLDHLSPFAEGSANRVTTTTPASVGDLVLLAVAVEGATSVAAVGGDTLLNVGGISSGATDTGADLVGSAPSDGNFSESASLGTSHPWLALGVALRGAPTAGPTEYTVSFTPTGLPNGTAWGMTFAGVAAAAVAPEEIAWTVPNGTYDFAVTPVPGYLAIPSVGLVNVSGSGSNASIDFESAVGPDGAYIQHVVVIVMENAELWKVLKDGPYEAYLSKAYGHASQFYAACHGSLPNYLALTSGRTFGCNWMTPSSTTNLADRFDGAGLTWGGYFESMPVACDGTSSGLYYVQHNPFHYYTDISHNASRCKSRVVNSAIFNESLADGTLANFSFYIPNMEDDCHNTGIAFCDQWLREFLTPILNSTNATVQETVAHTAFFILYDEGSTHRGYSVGGLVNPWCLNKTGLPLTTCGGRTYLTVVSPYSHHRSDLSPTSPYSVESTIEWLFGLPSDGGWDGLGAFPPLSSLFSFPTGGEGGGPDR